MGFIPPSIRVESQGESIGICPSPAITGSGKSIIQILFSICLHQRAEDYSRETLIPEINYYFLNCFLSIFPTEVRGSSSLISIYLGTS